MFISLLHFSSMNSFFALFLLGVVSFIYFYISLDLLNMLTFLSYIHTKYFFLSQKAFLQFSVLICLCVMFDLLKAQGKPV